MLFQASSTDIEHIFSRGRDLLDYRRNRLTAESMRALLCVGNWIRNGIITIDNITGFLAAGDGGAESATEDEEELEAGEEDE